MAGRVAVVGTGLIGGSVGLALAAPASTCVGFDRDEPGAWPRRSSWARSARRAASIDDAVAGAELVIVAVPVGAIAETVVAALDAGAPVVTDVGSVKAPVVAEVEAARPDESARFVGGHPMAGSEQDGRRRAPTPTLFVGRDLGAHADRRHRRRVRTRRAARRARPRRGGRDGDARPPRRRWSRW